MVRVILGFKRKQGNETKRSIRDKNLAKKVVTAYRVNLKALRTK